MSKPREQRNQKHNKKVQSFLSDGLNDYIAARVLFLSQLPQQGAILSSTAIEKYFKAILAFRGNESHGHLKKAHWNAVRNFDKELFSKLDYGFIELNRKAYLLRYTDDLPQNFNLVIASREFLAELDHTVLALQQRFSISQDGEPCRTKFQALLSARDSRIFSENHVLARTPKEDFIYQSPQYVYEVRNDGSRGLVEVNYMTTSKAIVAGFLRPGFTPKDNEHKSYELSHLPLSSSRG